MSSRDYPRLDIVDFGRQLIESGDLDPVYNALVAMDLDSTTLNRWLLAYWCLYHAGVASYIADASTAGKFWDRLGRAAINAEESPVGGRWPRGHERRHWRGANATKSFQDLVWRYHDQPEAMATYCATGDLHGQTSFATNETFASVTKRAQEHVAFGPWIGFKIADMAERVMGVPVFFDEREVFLFDSPREAAETLYADNFPGIEPHSKATSILWSLAYLKDAFKDLKAPPLGDRPIGVQEVETVLCKWKSHRNGHYPLYNDIREIRAGLATWRGRSDLAEHFFNHLPEASNA